MADNACRVALAPLVAQALRIERRGHPTSRLSDIAEEEHITRGIPLQAPTPSKIVDKAIRLITFGKVKNARDIPGIRSIHDKMLNHDNPRVKALGQRLFREDVGGNQANGVVTEVSVVRERAMLQVRVMKQYRPNYLKWLSTKGGKDTDELQLEFAHAVTKALRRGGVDESDPHVTRFAQIAREHGYDPALVRGKKSGTFDESISPDENYINRVYQADAFRKIRSEPGGVAKIDEVFANGMRNELKKAGVAIDEARLTRLARGMVQNILDRADGIDLGSHHGLPLDNLDKLAEMLEGFKLDRADIDYITLQLKTKASPDQSAIGVAKQRVKIDETATSNDGTLKFEDLLENDFRKLFGMYTDRVGADVAFRDTLGVAANEAGIMKLANEIRAEGDESMAIYAEKALRDLAGLRSSLVNPDSLWLRMSSTLTNLSYTTFGGFFGASSLAETSGIAAKMGTVQAFKNIPDLSRLRNNALDGKIDDAWVDHVTNYTALGMDSIVHPMRVKSQKWDAVREDWVNARTGFERFAEKARDLTVRGSGIRWVTDMQRKETTKAILSEIERTMLKPGARMSRGMVLRLAQMGYDEKSLKALHGDMAKYRVGVESMGRTTARADLEAWAAESPEIHARFMDAILRETERTIIETSVGHSPYWITTPAGRPIGQFMGFTLRSYNAHLLRGGNLRDFQTFNNVVGSAFIASQVYMARTYLQYGHDPKKLEERLTLKAIIAGGVAKSSAGGLPAMFADNAFGALGLPGPFEHTRASGLSTAVVSSDSVPSVAILNNILNTSKGLAQVLTGQKPLTGDDFDRLMRLTPATLLPSVRNTLETGAADLFDIPLDDPR